MTGAVNLSDTSAWLPLDALAPGFDASKATLSDALDGRTFTLVDDHGSRVAHAFGPGTVSRGCRPEADDEHGEAEHTDACEVIEVDDELYYVQSHHDRRPTEAVSLFLDLRSGWALSVIAVLGKKTPERVAVQHRFVTARIEELPQNGTPAAPTTELIGRRAL